MRQFHLIRRLGELGHEVTVIEPERPASKIAEGLRALRRRPGVALEAVTLPVLAWQAQIFWESMRERAVEAARRADVVVIEHDHAAAWRRDLPLDVPVVLTLHNRSPTMYRRRGLKLEAARWRRFYGRYLRDFERFVVVSKLDLRHDETSDLVPNGVDVEELKPTPEPDGPPTLLFTGTMNHPPNSEGVEWFVREILPRVPEAPLLVVGRNPPESVTKLASNRVEVTGAVPDVRPYFQQATVVVVPLLAGGGTRLKILEAFAAGRAVVSTSIGAEGLEVEHEKHLLTADGATEFADATARLLGDRALRERLTTEARRLVEDRYDWRILGEQLAEALTKAAERRP